ncbi:MAG TPA: MlaD family protein [Gammaproteobacteria bacterium]|nr:MlaD family protein [Gammaproteobacteria bacterium]
MEDRAHALVAVAFLLVLSAGAGFAVWWMQAGRPEVNYYYIVSTHGVGGLNPQAAVNYKGIQVGTVQKIGLAPGDPHKVRILVTLVKKAPVTSSTYAKMGSTGLTGMAHINLEDGGNGKPLKTSRQHPAVIPMRPSTLQQAEQQGTKLLDQARKITTQLSELLNDSNRKHFGAILAQLDQATRKLNTMEDHLTPALKRLPPMIDSAHQTLAESHALLKTMRKDARVFGQVGETSGQAMDQLTNQTLPGIDRLTDHLDETVGHVDRLTRRLSNRPSSVIFGRGEVPPGPGESGYKAPGSGK